MLSKRFAPVNVVIYNYWKKAIILTVQFKEEFLCQLVRQNESRSQSCPAKESYGNVEENLLNALLFDLSSLDYFAVFYFNLDFCAAFFTLDHALVIPVMDVI
jgi:hypothetical protein